MIPESLENSEPKAMLFNGLVGRAAFIVFVAIPCYSAVDIAFLHALSDVESGGNDKAIGRYGEISRFQIMPGTWQEMTGKFPSALEYRDASKAAYIVVRYMRELEDKFVVRTKRAPTLVESYMLWNCGFEGFRRRGFDTLRFPAKVRDRAERFSTLVYYYRSNN